MDGAKADSSESRHDMDALVAALRKTASFLSDCHLRFYREGSGWLGWNTWAENLLNWANQLASAREIRDDEALRSVLRAIRQDVVEIHMGNLSDNWISNERTRTSIEDLNAPPTDEEKAANKRKDELLDEIRKLYSQLAKVYDERLI